MSDKGESTSLPLEYILYERFASDRISRMRVSLAYHVQELGGTLTNHKRRLTLPGGGFWERTWIEIKFKSDTKEMRWCCQSGIDAQVFDLDLVLAEIDTLHREFMGQDLNPYKELYIYE